MEDEDKIEYICNNFTGEIVGTIEGSSDGPLFACTYPDRIYLGMWDRHENITYDLRGMRKVSDGNTLRRFFPQYE